MALEREVKLGAWPGFTLPGLDDLGEGMTVGAVPTRTLEAVYHDTADLRLARWGVTVRHRSGDGEGWTVKLPDGTDGPALVRREVTFDGPPAAPPPAALDLVRAYVRRSALAPVARMRTVRSGLEVRDVEDQLVAEVVDDEVSVLHRGRVAARFREIEVEVSGRAPAGVQDAVVRRLREAGAGEPDPTPKVVRALGARAQRPPEVAPVVLARDPTMADVVRQAIGASVAQILVHDPGIRIGDDPEDVHKARVGTRRLRSDLRTLRSVLAEDWVEDLRGELKWLAQALGDVRDADVLSERLQRQAASLSELDAGGLAPLLRRLASEREEAVARLRDIMTGERYVELLDRLVTAARHPLLRPQADAGAGTVLPSLVARPWRRLRRAASAVGSQPSGEELHRVRIAAKRTRYAAEAAAPVVGGRAKGFARAVADLQTVLGDHNDAVVGEAWLRGAVDGAEAPQVLVAGELIAVQRAEQARSGEEWRGVWKRARKKKLRSWLA
jgi:CHAD domain-containing protein